MVCSKGTKSSSQGTTTGCISAVICSLPTSTANKKYGNHILWTKHNFILFETFNVSVYVSCINCSSKQWNRVSISGAIYLHILAKFILMHNFAISVLHNRHIEFFTADNSGSNGHLPNLLGEPKYKLRFWWVWWVWLSELQMLHISVKLLRQPNNRCSILFKLISDLTKRRLFLGSWNTGTNFYPMVRNMKLLAIQYLPVTNEQSYQLCYSE